MGQYTVSVKFIRKVITDVCIVRKRKMADWVCIFITGRFKKLPIDLSPSLKPFIICTIVISYSVSTNSLVTIPSTATLISKPLVLTLSLSLVLVCLIPKLLVLALIFSVWCLNYWLWNWSCLSDTKTIRYGTDLVYLMFKLLVMTLILSIWCLT